MKSLKHIIATTSVILLFTSYKSIDDAPINPTPQSISYSWLKTDSTFALMNSNQVVWQLNFNKKQDKPYFHPLRIRGHDLTLERPDDHPWHRGLWFSWKFINKVNYWEEDPKKGYSEGRSKIVKVDITPGKDYSATVSIALEYAPDGKEKLLTEERTLYISCPDAEGNYIIDWKLHFTAGDCLLIFDRTPPLKHGGEAWGGYAGLGYRGAGTLKDHVYTASTGWVNKTDYTGEAGDAVWMDMSAVINKQTSTEGGITMFDHPTNPRHPSPWYIWYEAGKHAFFTPAILYNGSIKLEPRKSMQLNYRVYIHSGRLDIQTTNEMFVHFQNEKL